jgi:membrane associated rhomboid family serine protease
VRQRVDTLWRLTPVVVTLAVMWLVTAINLLALRGAWLIDGVRAHDPGGLWPNLIWSPFLHVGLAHLVANSVPLLVLGGVIALRSPSAFMAVTIAGAIGGALVAWILGPPGSVHVGASGLVFAYFGWIIARAVRERSALAIVLALLTLVVYGGVLWGLSPFQVGISWQDHLGGLLSGMIVARLWPVQSKLGQQSQTLVSPQLSNIGR